MEGGCGNSSDYSRVVPDGGQPGQPCQCHCLPRDPHATARLQQAHRVLFNISLVLVTVSTLSGLSMQQQQQLRSFCLCHHRRSEKGGSLSTTRTRTRIKVYLIHFVFLNSKTEGSLVRPFCFCYCPGLEDLSLSEAAPVPKRGPSIWLPSPIQKNKKIEARAHLLLPPLVVIEDLWGE